MSLAQVLMQPLFRLDLGSRTPPISSEGSPQLRKRKNQQSDAPRKKQLRSEFSHEPPFPENQKVWGQFMETENFAQSTPQKTKSPETIHSHSISNSRALVLYQPPETVLGL
eukprot:TRINITY_DN5390_c0_g1_i1.p1 TRINITY_DN5390_c0_g1~~TRINITY_DN5390_c0_g1_i1.p1  ORF type:complete len:111 (+),score=13.79 TRINITY_DN5390_c0_g1_i1:115-447(+)